MPDTQISEEMVRVAAETMKQRRRDTIEGRAPHATYEELARAALEAALSGHVVGWRTMDSAPRDGKPIGACNTRHPSHAPVVVRWTDCGDEPHWCDAATPDGSALYFNQNYFDYWKPVTPLPASPVPEMEG